MKLENCITIAKEYLGKDYFIHLNIAFKASKDFNLLIVSKKDNDITIEYGQKSNLFRGLTLIKEKCDERSFCVELHKEFNSNGLMLDCSRNGVLRNEKVKEMILISALMGYNRLLLYTEDTFKLDKYPYFGYLRGPYTKEDIKDFVEYGESFGVELVPCIQTLGHLRQALKWEPMSYLKDGEDTLLVDSPKVYDFIEDIIKFSRECFKSKEIHIGMDESFEMGLHRHLQIYGFENRVELFLRHLSKIKDICLNYDFSPMIWSDMFFRLNNENDGYYQDEPLPELTLKSIPRDIKLVYWDYYHDNVEDYLRMIRFHKQAGNPLVFAGGSWRWKGYAPSISKSIEYSKYSLEACKREDVKDIFITAWADDGNECSFFTILPVLAEASVVSYGQFNEEKINSLLMAISDDTLEDFLSMDLPDMPDKKLLSPMYNPSKYFLYQDVLLGMFDYHVKDEYANNYAEFALILSNKASKSKRCAYIYDYLAKLCDVLAIKIDLGVKVREAYKNNDTKTLKELTNRIDVLVSNLELFRKSIEYKWMLECRVFGFEVLDGRLGFLKNRILTAQSRIAAYLNGDIKKIEELEVDILPFDGKEEEICWNYWLRNVSPSN